MIFNIIEAEVDEMTQKLGFLAMMNPNSTNKPPPAFIRRVIDPNYEAKESKESKLPLPENTQMEKPLMKRK